MFDLKVQTTLDLVQEFLRLARYQEIRGAGPPLRPACCAPAPLGATGGFTELHSYHLANPRQLSTVIGMANTAVFTERLEVRLRPDQKERLDLTASILNCDVAALVRLAIDNMFEEMQDIRRREARWQEQIAAEY